MTFLRKVRLENLLSFGPAGQELDLGPLNVLIGRNGSGKSNLPAALGILAAAPRNLPTPIRAAGGTSEWLWKGADQPPVATVEATVDYPAGDSPLTYRLSFTAKGSQFTLVDEAIENADPSSDEDLPSFYYRYQGGQPILNVRTEEGVWQEKTVDPEYMNSEPSVLRNYIEPLYYPQITYLGEMFPKILIYPQWSFSRHSPPRQPVSTDSLASMLLDDASNLALVMSNLLNKPTIRREILEKIRTFDPDIEDIVTNVNGRSMQIYTHEKGLNHPISAMHFGDGLLQYLCLLAVLYKPEPPPLICLSEPESNLHPDIISNVAKLLIEASSRSQIIVTTQSDIIVDALTETPESVVVCEKYDNSTQLHRLSREPLQHWLDDHRLGEVWATGAIGGNRW